MSRRTLLLISVAIVLALPLTAQMRQRPVVPPPSASAADVLGIGPMRGASVAGTVSAVAGKIVTLKSGGAAAITIDVSNAKIVADRDASRTLADIVPGVRLTALIGGESSVAPGAALPARVIILATEPDLFVSGAIDSIDVAGSAFSVLGIRIAADAKTIFSTAFPTFAPVRDVSGLAVGQFVEVDAAFAGPAILAKRVFVTSPGSPVATMLRGTVKSIGQTAWIITDKSGKDVTIQVNDHTKIAGELKTGDEVQVVATTDAAGNYVALLIAGVGPRPVGPTQMHGWVKSIGAEQWSIGGPPGSMAPEYLVKVTPATVIYPNPKVGDVVDVTGTPDAADVLVAAKIELAKRP